MQQITEFRTALAENDQETIIRMIESKISITEAYDLRCDAEDCECVQKEIGRASCRERVSSPV